MAPREPSATVPSQGESSAAAHAFLLLVGPGHLGTYPVAADRPLAIGPDATCDVALAHHTVSRRHLTVRVESGGACAVRVEDLGSTNGILVAGRRLEPKTSVVLAPGDSFQLGPFTGLVVAE